jgi:hypothetical protein
MAERPRHWRPLTLTLGAKAKHPDLIKVAMQDYGVDEAAAIKIIDEDAAKCACYINDLYQVQARQMDNGMLHLNIRRPDGAATLRDWRHFQQIKNEIAGPEREAFEIYPAESRKVDTSNKWHLWVLPEGERVPVGWSERDVRYDENRDVAGMRQRPL